jgi:hypothetical protein
VRIELDRIEVSSRSMVNIVDSGFKSIAMVELCSGEWRKLKKSIVTFRVTQMYSCFSYVEEMFSAVLSTSTNSFFIFRRLKIARLWINKGRKNSID